jgi:cation diffusion facilitator family transporter
VETPQARAAARARRNVAIASLLIGIVLCGAKFWAYVATGSAAVLSDALESILNIAAAALLLFSLSVSARPADRDHPYGHGKAEDFSAGVEGALIVLAAVAILRMSIPRLLHPAELAQLDVGLAIVFGAGAVNGVLGLFLVRAGRKLGSRALSADGRHVLTDTITSGGVVAGLLLVWLTHWNWVDPLVACLVALQILASGGKLVRESVGRLMDEADEHLLSRIADSLQRSRRPEWIDIHQLRAWRSGRFLHMDCHLTLPRYFAISQSHTCEKEVEAVILRELGADGEVMVHIDPCSPECCHLCTVHPCPVREEAFVEQRAWTAALLVAPGAAVRERNAAAPLR